MVYIIQRKDSVFIMGEQKIYIADKETQDAIKALIGLINDTGGTASAGTLMAKLNAVINYVLTNNSGSATGTLSQKLTYIISTLLGTTGATGGTATAGTLMAKANRIINDLSTILSNTNTMKNNSGGYSYVNSFGTVTGNTAIVPLSTNYDINLKNYILNMPNTDSTNTTSKPSISKRKYAYVYDISDRIMLVYPNFNMHTTDSSDFAIAGCFIIDKKKQCFIKLNTKSNLYFCSQSNSNYKNIFYHAAKKRLLIIGKNGSIYEIYNIDGNTGNSSYTTLPSSANPYRASLIDIINGKIYIFGHSSSDCRFVIVYNAETNKVCLHRCDLYNYKYRKSNHTIYANSSTTYIKIAINTSTGETTQSDSTSSEYNSTSNVTMQTSSNHSDITTNFTDKDPDDISALKYGNWIYNLVQYTKTSNTGITLNWEDMYVPEGTYRMFPLFAWDHYALYVSVTRAGSSGSYPHEFYFIDVAKLMPPSNEYKLFYLKAGANVYTDGIIINETLGTYVASTTPELSSLPIKITEQGRYLFKNYTFLSIQ